MGALVPRSRSRSNRSRRQLVSALSEQDCWSSTGYPDAAEGYFHASWGCDRFRPRPADALYPARPCAPVFPREGWYVAHIEYRYCDRVPGREELPVHVSSWQPCSSPAQRSSCKPARAANSSRLVVPCTEFPAQLGGWTGTDRIIDKETLKVLKPSGGYLRARLSEPARNPITSTLFIPYLPQPARRRSPAFAPALPSRIWLDADREPTHYAHHAGSRTVSRKPLSHREWRSPPTRALLVLGTRPRSRQ